MSVKYTKIHGYEIYKSWVNYSLVLDEGEYKKVYLTKVLIMARILPFLLPSKPTESPRWSFSCLGKAINPMWEVLPKCSRTSSWVGWLVGRFLCTNDTPVGHNYCMSQLRQTWVPSLALAFIVVLPLGNYKTLLSLSFLICHMGW